VLHGRPVLRLTRIPACELTPRAENLLAQEKLRWLVQGNARKCPWKFRKSCQPAPAIDHPPARPPARDPAVAASTTGGDRLRNGRVTRLRRYYTRHMHFLNFPFPPGCASPRGNVISSRYNAPAGTIPSCMPQFARASNVKTGARARYFYLRVN
jgi:hypothetical protein